MPIIPELLSKKDVESISLDLLKDSKSFGVFPTPVEQIVKHAELVVDREVDLGKVDHRFFDFATEKIERLMDKVRGVLDRSERTIYLDLSQSVNRQGFVSLHETGHAVLTWQQATLDFMDDDVTLDSDTEEQFEAEANYFASITLFQHDRFDEEARKHPLSLKSVTHLSKYFGASVHATFRRYVERSQKRCALLILKNISERGAQPSCQFRDFFCSQSFQKEFGILDWNKEFGFKWLFVQDYYFGRKYKTNGVIQLETSLGSVSFNYHFFNNGFNAFVFLFPLGEMIKSRTKFIMSN